jgi:hypothetical protein
MGRRAGVFAVFPVAVNVHRWGASVASVEMTAFVAGLRR